MSFIASFTIGFSVTSLVTLILMLLSNITFGKHLSKMYLFWIFITSVLCGMSANLFYKALIK